MAIGQNPNYNYTYTPETRVQTCRKVVKDSKPTIVVTVACLVAAIGLAIIIGIGKAAATVIAGAVIISPWGIVGALAGLVLVGTLYLIYKCIVRSNDDHVKATYINENGDVITEYAIIEDRYTNAYGDVFTEYENNEVISTFQYPPIPPSLSRTPEQTTDDLFANYTLVPAWYSEACHSATKTTNFV